MTDEELEYMASVRNNLKIRAQTRAEPVRAEAEVMACLIDKTMASLGYVAEEGEYRRKDD